jgi:hypothetical protein
VTLEETFAKVVGRDASDDERQRLYRLRDSLGLRDNDAFWSIVMALEYYDSFFRRHPAELADYTERCIEDARAAFAAAAEREGRAGAADALREGRGDERGDCSATRRETRRPSPGDDAVGRGGRIWSLVRQRRLQPGSARAPLPVTSAETLMDTIWITGVSIVATTRSRAVLRAWVQGHDDRTPHIGAIASSVEVRSRHGNRRCGDTDLPARSPLARSP